MGRMETTAMTRCTHEVSNNGVNWTPMNPSNIFYTSFKYHRKISFDVGIKVNDLPPGFFSIQDVGGVVGGGSGGGGGGGGGYGSGDGGAGGGTVGQSIKLAIETKSTTLPTDSNDRKNYPLLSGCLKYFPAALASVANVSKLGNDKHNPGEPLHHAREKSTDHGDCIARHLMDTEDLLSAFSQDNSTISPDQILLEVSQLAWRALAYSQILHERFGAPLAPGAKIGSKK